MAWKLAYAHDAAGVPCEPFSDADRVGLANKVAAGVPIRLGVTVPQFGVEALLESTDRAFVDHGHVFALVPQYVINVKSDAQTPITSWNAYFDPSPAVFSTEGTERHRVPRGTEYRNPLPMLWFVEVSDVTGDDAWVKVYEHDAAGAGTFGSLSALVDAVRQGRPIRLVSHDFNGQVETAVFPTARVITNLDQVFASVPLFIQSFRYRPGENANFDPYNYDSYLFGRPVTGVSVFGTDGSERYRAGDSAPGEENSTRVGVDRP